LHRNAALENLRDEQLDGLSCLPPGSQLKCAVLREAERREQTTRDFLPHGENLGTIAKSVRESLTGDG
jgi:hypothetical protein